jgi:hypothetical protein
VKPRGRAPETMRFPGKVFSLGKMSRQLDQVINLSKTIDKKLSVNQSKEELSASHIQGQIDELTRKLKTKENDIDWKG